ncbi:MAG: putative zinc-binding metallopeptidase [Paludibacter sp.]
MKIYLFRCFVAFIITITITACSNDELFGPTIFEKTNAVLDSTSYTYNFDSYLTDNYLKTYNLQFRYKMQDMGTDMSFNLVPATLDNSKKIAVLVKYLWFDVYAKVVGPDFLKLYGPRIIHLIGSPAYNPANGTMLLGLAEGGLKVSLFRINSMDPTNIEMMNEFYFKTMHHEFAHILHQTKSYPKDFNLISFKNYEPFSWQDRDEKLAASLGFASSYGGSQTREDFVEIIANYIVKTDAQWNQLMLDASKGWKVEITDDAKGNKITTIVEIPDADGVDGHEVILRKLSICRTWLADAWNVDLDALRAEVQKRQSNIPLDSLLLDIDKRK